MKLSVVAAALLVTAVSAEKCVYSTVAPNLHSLGTVIAKCMTATGNAYNIARGEAPPTPEMTAAICSKCEDFVDAVAALPPWPDCTLNLGGSDQTLTSYFDKIVGSCKAGQVVETSAPTTAAPTSEETTAPSESASSGSQASQVEGAGSTDGAANGAVVTTAPVVASSSPVPSPTSSAASTAVSSLAACVAALSVGVLSL